MNAQHTLDDRALTAAAKGICCWAGPCQVELGLMSPPCCMPWHKDRAAAAITIYAAETDSDLVKALREARAVIRMSSAEDDADIEASIRKVEALCDAAIAKATGGTP